MSGAATPPDGSERFTIELPAEPAYVATARMFASTLARHFEVEEELVDDIKLAVSEACTRALGSDGELALAALHVEGRLTFEVAQVDLPAPSPEADTPTPEELAAGLGVELIRALFEDADLVRGTGGGRAIRFSVPSA